MKLNIATVFSGIGAFEQALIKLNIDHKIVFACDNGERVVDLSDDEIFNYRENLNINDQQIFELMNNYYDKLGTNWMKKSYLENYDLDPSNFYEDIRFLRGYKYRNKVDIFVGGSPCQSFSLMGKRAGLEDARGTLFYDYARLINEIKPKVFVYENVPGMLVHDKGNTWKVIKEIFESLNYKVFWGILNAKDYGMPQDRKRLFVVGFKNNNIDFKFPDTMELTKTMFDFLEEKVDAKYYLGKKGFEFVTTHPGRARINQNIIRTQKANQQFNWNGDFVFEEYDSIKNREDVIKRAYVGNWNDKIGVVRQLTHRECLRLMGFSDSYKIIVPNTWAYRQAGNSIVVNVIEEVVKEIMRVENFNEKN